MRLGGRKNIGASLHSCSLFHGSFSRSDMSKSGEIIGDSGGSSESSVFSIRLWRVCSKASASFLYGPSKFKDMPLLRINIAVDVFPPMAYKTLAM